MKSLAEFKKESIKVSPPPEEWITVFNKLILLFADWGLTEEYVDSFTYTCEGDLADDCFEANFIDHFIHHALRISPFSVFFGRMFEITKTTILTPYFDSDKWDFNINKEAKIFKGRLPGDVYYDMTIGKIEDISRGKEIYEKLEDIKKIFPIYIKD